MHPDMNRRDVLKAAGFAAAGLALSPFAAAQNAAAERKKVLFFTKSQGFQHSAITRPKKDPQKLAFAEQLLTDLGAKHGFDVTCSKDGTIFSPENIAEPDAGAFYTTMDLTQGSDKYDALKGRVGQNGPYPSQLLRRAPA